MVTVYINRWGIKIPALLYCYPSKTKGPEYFFLSLSILLFSIIDKAIMQHSDSHHLVEVNLHRCQLLLNLTLTFFKERSISLIYPHFGHLISIFPVVIVILSKTHHSPDKAAIIRINVLVTCIFSFQFKWKDSIFIDWNYSLHLFGIAQAFDTLFFKNFLNYFFRKIF